MNDPEPAIFSTASPFRVLLWKEICPEDSGIMPDMQRSSVVFPWPFGPTMPTTVPSGTESETSRRTGRLR